MLVAAQAFQPSDALAPVEVGTLGRVGLSDELKESSARTPALILAALVLLGIGLAAVVAFQSGGPETVASQVVRASPRSTTTSSTVAVGESTTSSSTPPAAVPTVTQAPGGGSPVTTVVPTTAEPAPVQTTAAAPPPPPPSTQCTPAQADQTLTADKPTATYIAGEIVTVTATVRNHSTTSCTLADPDGGCYSLLSAINGADPNPYWRSGMVASRPCSPPPRRTLLPGQVATLTAAWDQSDRRGCRPDNSDPGCSKPRVAGLYTIQSRWLSEVKGTTLTLA